MDVGTYSSKNSTHWLGLWFAILVMACWVAGLAAGFGLQVQAHPLIALVLVLVQTHLFTGVFITAHDAMHGSVVPGQKAVNVWVGRLAAGLFALNSFDVLKKAHHLHHAHAGTAADPDYHPPGFWRWYWRFLKQYLSIWQLIGMAVLFNVAALWISQIDLILFYVLPSLLSTLQLFYFGTYLPHRGEHAASNVHKARSQAQNDLWAFLSCYFFGYHWEHHEWPGTPWWQLPARKRQLAKGKN